MTTLKLQILLGAVDKLTAPLKRVSGQSRLTAQDLVDTKKKIRDLESQSGQVDGFRSLGRQIGATRAEMVKAQREVVQLSLGMNSVERPTKAMTTAFEKAKQAASALEQKERDMVARYASLKQAFTEAGIDTTKLSQHQHKLKTDLAAANTELDQQRTKLSQLADQQHRMNQLKANYRHTQELRGKLAGQGAAAIATGTAMGMATLKPVIEFSRAETAATDLRVSMMGSDGKVRQEFQAISDLATQLGNKLPGTTAELQTMMSTLIQQGMSAKSILGGLGEATAYLGVQLKLPYDQAALFAAKLQDATKTSEKDMMGLMDVIQRAFYLGMDSSSMQAGFSKLAPALGVLKKTGLEAAKTLAPLLVMADQAAMSGEAAGNAYRKIFQMSMNTGKIKKATDGMGLSLNFTDGKGEFGGLEQMYGQLAKLKSLNTEKRLQVLKGIYGDDAETLQALNLMIDKGLDGYRETLKKMADQASLQQRVNAQLGTLGNLWDAATGTFTNAMVNFGEALAPEIKAITQWIGELSERLGNWAKKNPELSNTLMKIGAIVSVATIAIGGLLLAVSAILGPFAILRLTFGMMGGPVSILGKAISMLLGPLKMLTLSVFRLGITLLTTPIGWFILGIAAIAGGAYLIYKNWDSISKWFTDLWDKCKAPLLAFWDLLKEIFSWTPIGMLTMHWGEIWAFFDTLPDGAVNKGKAIVQGLIDGITAKWKTLMEKVKTFTQYLPDWVTGGNVTIASEGASGPGYLTGNTGSLATAGASGYGPRIADTPKLMPRASTTTVHSQPFYQLTINAPPGMNQEQLGKLMMDKIKESERANKASDRATLSDRN